MSTEPAVNVDTLRVGGVRFIRIGRLFFSFGLSRRYRRLGARA